MSHKFCKYVILNFPLQIETQFSPSKTLPQLPITTPFTFPKYNNKFMLALDKNGWWNPLGGHMEQGETFLETISRESYEEAGITVKNIIIVGYITATNITNYESKYPKVSILPITVSEILHIDRYWKPKETKKRKLLTEIEVIKNLSTRNDNNQMLEIFKYIKDLNE